MPAMCVMPAGNIALSGLIAGMASSYRRPARTLGQLVQEACSHIRPARTGGQFVQRYAPENCVFKASKASVGAGHARDVCYVCR